jgi:hypothetical protein
MRFNSFNYQGGEFNGCNRWFMGRFHPVFTGRDRHGILGARTAKAPPDGAQEPRVLDGQPGAALLVPTMRAMSSDHFDFILFSQKKGVKKEAN